MRAGTPPGAPEQAVQRYPMAPLIRFTLIGLYLVLVLPLPPLAMRSGQPAALVAALWLALPLGLMLVLAVTSEQVRLDAGGIQVGHPGWCRWLLRRGWSLDWPEISGLTPVATSQGGRVFYVRRRPQPGAAAEAYLLPQRIARFDDFLRRFGEASGLDTGAIGRISPPWTYRLLAALVALLLGGELLTLGI